LLTRRYRRVSAGAGLLDPTAPYCAGWNGCWTGRCRFGQLSTAGRVTRAKAQAVFAAEHIMTSAVSDPCLDRHKRLVYTGGCFDWGDRGEEMITELTPLSPSPMGQGHAREAAALQRLHDERGLDVVRLNPGLCTAREPAQDCLHRPRRAWVGCAASELAGTGGGCAHVEDLGRAYAVPRLCPDRITPSRTTSRSGCGT
jgi:hypothetical protein